VQATGGTRNLQFHQVRHALHVVHGALGQLAGLFEFPYGRIQPGRQVQANDPEKPGGDLHLRLSAGLGETREPKEGAPLHVRILVHGPVDQRPEFVCLFLGREAIEQDPGALLEACVGGKKRCRGLAELLGPVSFQKAPVEPHEGDHVQGVGRWSGPGGDLDCRSRLVELPAQYIQLQIGPGHLVVPGLVGLLDQAVADQEQLFEVGIPEAHHLELEFLGLGLGLFRPCFLPRGRPGHALDDAAARQRERERREDRQQPQPARCGGVLPHCRLCLGFMA